MRVQGHENASQRGGFLPAVLRVVVGGPGFCVFRGGCVRGLPPTQKKNSLFPPPPAMTTACACGGVPVAVFCFTENRFLCATCDAR